MSLLDEKDSLKIAETLIDDIEKSILDRTTVTVEEMESLIRISRSLLDCSRTMRAALDKVIVNLEKMGAP